MFDSMKLSGFLAAGVLAVGLGAGAASAATIEGQIDITGTVNLTNSVFTSTGNVDMSATGLVLVVDGDFASTISYADVASLTDVNFAAPGQIWSVGGFTFTATSFDNISKVTNTNGSGTATFEAFGIITGNSYDPTQGDLIFSTQWTKTSKKTKLSFSSTTVAPIPLPAAGFLLVGALGGLAGLRRRKAPMA